MAIFPQKEKKITTTLTPPPQEKSIPAPTIPSQNKKKAKKQTASKPQVIQPELQSQCLSILDSFTFLTTSVFIESLKVRGVKASRKKIIHLLQQWNKDKLAKYDPATKLIEITPKGKELNREQTNFWMDGSTEQKIITKRTVDCFFLGDTIAKIENSILQSSINMEQSYLGFFARYHFLDKEVAPLIKTNPRQKQITPNIILAYENKGKTILLPVFIPSNLPIQNALLEKQETQNLRKTLAELENMRLSQETTDKLGKLYDTEFKTIENLVLCPNEQKRIRLSSNNLSPKAHFTVLDELPQTLQRIIHGEIKNAVSI